MQNTVGASLSNRRTVAMVVNDDAENLIPRGVLKPIASKLAPHGTAIASET